MDKKQLIHLIASGITSNVVLGVNDYTISDLLACADLSAAEFENLQSTQMWTALDNAHSALSAIYDLL